MSLTVKAFLRKSPAGATPEYEIRRFEVDVDVLSSFVYLVQKITTVFSSLENKTIELFWRDSENDLITFSSDDELTEALSYINDGVFKVYIEEKSETRRETKETGSSHGVYHPRIICDGCEGRVRGLRYKCTVCPDFDLCSGCKSAGLHSEHEMITIEKPVCRPYSGRFRAFDPPPYGCFPCPPLGMAPQHGMVPLHGMGPPHRLFAPQGNVPQAYPTNCDEIRMQRRAWRRWMKANCGADSCKKEKKEEKEDVEKRECNFGGRGWSGWGRCRGGFRQMGVPFGGFSSAHAQAAPAGGSFRGSHPPPEPQLYTQSHETDTDTLTNREEMRMQRRAWRRWMKWNCRVDPCKAWKKEKKEENEDEEKHEKRERKAERKAMREAERAKQAEAAPGEVPTKADKDSNSSSSSSDEGDTGPTGIDVGVDVEHRERRKHCQRGGPWGCHFKGNFGGCGWDGWGRGRGGFCQMGFPFGGLSSAPVRGPFQGPPPAQLYPQSHQMDTNSERNREEMRMQRRAWRRWMRWNCGVDPCKAWKKEKKEENEDKEEHEKRERKAERKAMREAERAKQAEAAPGEAPTKADKDSNSSSSSSNKEDTTPTGIDMEVDVEHRERRKHCQRGGPWGCHMMKENFGGRGWDGWNGWGRGRDGLCQMGFPFGGFSSAPACGPFQGPLPPQLYPQLHEIDTDSEPNREEMRMQRRAWRRWMKWNCGVDPCKTWKKEKKEEKTDEEEHEKRERKTERKAKREAEWAKQEEAAPGEAPPKADKDSNSSLSSSDEEDTPPTGIDAKVDVEHTEKRKHCQRGGPWGYHMRGNFGGRGCGGLGRCSGGFCQMGFPFGGFSSAPACGPFQGSLSAQLYPQLHEIDTDSEPNREEMRMQRRAWRRWTKWNCGVDPCKKEKKEEKTDEEEHEKRERKAVLKAKREAERAKQGESVPGEAPPKADKDSNSSSSSSNKEDANPTGIDVEVHFEHKGRRKHCQRGGPWGCHMRGNFGGRGWGGWGICRGGFCPMEFPFGGGFSSVHAQAAPIVNPFQGPPPPSELQPYPQSHEMNTNPEINREEIRMQRRAWRRWMKWNCGVDPCKAWKKKNEEKTDEEKQEKRQRKAECKAKKEAERAKQAGAEPIEAKAAESSEPDGWTLVVGHDEAGVAEAASGVEMSGSE